MIYFDSDMSKSTNTVVYFDWKTVINIYVCGKCRTQFMLPMEKSVTFTGACANEITGYTEWITRSFVSKAKEWGHIRIINNSWLVLCCFVCLFVFVLFCFVLFCFLFCFVLFCFVFWFVFCFVFCCLSFFLGGGVSYIAVDFTISKKIPMHSLNLYEMRLKRFCSN